MRVVLSFVLLLSFIACIDKSTITHPIRKDLVQAVYASGKIFPLNHVRIAAKTTGYVKRILVKSGDVVKAGSPLVLLSNPNSDVNIDIARSNLALSELNNQPDRNQLNAAMQEIRSAYSRYQLDSLNYQRYKNLWEKQITSRVNLDAAKTQSEVSYQSYEKAIDNYNALRTRSNTEVALARKQLQLQSNNKSDFVITAPMTGRVYDVPVKEGQLLTIGSQAVDFGDSTLFEAELDVDESDIGLVKTGQRVILNAEAYDHQPITSTVREIEPSVIQGNKTTRVKTSVPPTGLTLFSGMTVEANIIIREKKNVLVIPAEFLNADNTVTLRSGKKRVPVKTGIRDVQYVEIESGIDETAEIVRQ